MATLPFAACLIGLSCLTPAHPPASIFQLTSQFHYAQAAAVSSLLFALSFVLVLVTERLVSQRAEGFWA